MMAVDSGDRREVVVKIDGGGRPSAAAAASSIASPSEANAGKIWRESSYDFWKQDSVSKTQGVKVSSNRGDDGFDFLRRAGGTDDPPSKLIGQFLHKQRASGEVSLDMDLNMVELSSRGLTPISESLSVSGRNQDGSVRRRQTPLRNGSSDESNDEQEVVKCSSSNRSVQTNSSLLRTRTKSRLLDPPTPPAPAPEMKSGRLPKSGFFGKTPEEEEEEDPFADEDLPEEFKRDKLSFWILLEWVSLILIIAALVCSLSIPFLRKKKLLKLMLWKWEVLVLVLICGRLVSSWIVRMAVFFIERNFLLRKRVLYFVYGIRKAVQNCLWLGLVLIAWHLLFDKRVERETKNDVLRKASKVLACLVVGVLFWLVKTLLVKVLASSFHMSTYFDRIQDSLFNQYVIETLSGPPLIEIQRNEEEVERIENDMRDLQKAGAKIPPGLKAAACPSPGVRRVPSSGGLQKSPQIGKSPMISQLLSKEGEDKGITIDHLHKLNPKNVSAWKMKRLMNIVRKGALSTLDEQIQDTSSLDEKTTQIKSEYEAKLAARRIFNNVAKPGSKYIFLDDIMRFMLKDEALKTMSLFEGSSDTTRISKSSLKNWVVNAFRERRALALTLNDTKTAVDRLHKMVNVLVSIIILIIWLLILGIATTKFLLFISSQLVLVAFIFGNTCKTVFEAIIFLFVIHPFDVGDRCEIDGVQLVVEEMNILTTVFLRYDNQKVVYPNSLLWTKSIGNFYRSPDMGDGVEFCIHISTPAEKISLMKQRITSYVENKKDHWYPAPMFVFKDMEDLTKVRIAVWLTHRINHQDMGAKWERRSQLVEEIAKICRDLDIQYRLYPLDINVRSLPPAPVTSDRVPPSWTPQGS